MEISRYIYDQSSPQGQPRFAGVSYLSKLGDNLWNWALFESATSDPPPASSIELVGVEPDNDDFRAALELFGLQLTGEA